MLFIPTYFAPIAQYVAIMQQPSIVFEVEDNFQKQTYRNRCLIYGANGKLQLNVPIKHTHKGGRQKSKDIQIKYSEHWQKLHFKSMQSAYRSSPYFEFYEDDLQTIFEKKHTFLHDLNFETHAFIMDAMQEEIPFVRTEKYDVSPSIKDNRSLAIAKGKRIFDFKPYVQVFDDKYGFIPNLSILDLLFMEGPNTSMYLAAQKI
ncbi:WbqC family protein [Urechidicola sp. KH5]